MLAFVIVAFILLISPAISTARGARIMQITPPSSPSLSTGDKAKLTTQTVYLGTTVLLDLDDPVMNTVTNKPMKSIRIVGTLPSWVTFSNSTNTFTFKPSLTEFSLTSSIKTITFNLTDTLTALNTTYSFSISVVNRKPYFTANFLQVDYTMNLYESLTVQVPAFKDDDGHSLIISMQSFLKVAPTVNTNYTF